MSAAASEDSAATIGAASQQEEEEDTIEHVEALVHASRVQRRPRSTSALRYDPRLAVGAKGPEGGVRSAAVGGVGLGRSTHVMKIAPRMPPIPRAKLVAKARGDQRCVQWGVVPAALPEVPGHRGAGPANH